MNSLATELERGPDGWFTGEIRSEPNMREGKVRRMQQWLAQRQWDWSDVEAPSTATLHDASLLEKSIPGVPAR